MPLNPLDFEPNDPRSGAKLITVLNTLEAELDPSSFSQGPFNFWPIIRFSINFTAKKGCKTVPNPAPQKWLKHQMKRAARPLANFKNRHPKLHLRIKSRDKALLALPNADVLFFNRANRYVNTFSGNVAQPFSDGLRYLTNDQGLERYTVVEGDPRKGRRDFLVPSATLPRPPKSNTLSLLQPITRTEKQLRDNVIERTCAVNVLLKDLAPELKIDENFILNRIEREATKADYFGRFLDQICPKVVFITSYTGTPYVCAAAKTRGVTVVDIQHGSMHSHHPLSANWSHAPSGGFELLPDVFWCWNTRSAGYINKTMPINHHALVGGNPKAALERHLSVEDFAPRSTNERPQILVALQYGLEDLLRPHVLDAYRLTKNIADWHFRLHPMGWSQIGKAMELLGVSKDRLEAVSQVPLYQQLPAMDLLLTNHSTIVYEAVEVGLRAAVCTRHGAATFDDLLNSGSIAFANDTQTILEMIRDFDSLSVNRQTAQSKVTRSSEEVISEIRRGYQAVLERSGLS